MGRVPVSLLDRAPVLVGPFLADFDVTNRLSQAVACYNWDRQPLGAGSGLDAISVVPMPFDELGAVIPRYIRQDVLLDMALAMAARWPGPSVDAPNPYYDLNLSDRIERKCEMMIGEMEKNDDNVYESMVGYAANMEFAPWFDARFLQKHSI